VLRNELKSENPENQKAAIYALSAWPDAEPIDELLDIVKTTPHETHKILALRGYIDLVKIRSDLPDKESIDLYMKAMDLASEASEKRMVLSGLGRLHSLEALEVTARYLDDPAIQPEAEAAVLMLLDEIYDTDKERLNKILNDILEITNNPSLRERAMEIIRKQK
jgi:hypothetical protein